MPTSLVLAGGWAHPAHQTGPCTADALTACGLSVEVVDDVVDAAARLDRGDVDLLTVHACRFRMLDARYDDEQRRSYAERCPDDLRRAIAEHLGRGRPMLALHTAPICFDDWADWPSLVGATWRWDRSNHPPPGPFTVDPEPVHPVTAGLAPFTVHDELYRFVEPAPGAQVLARARDADGIVHPLAWLHRAGVARVAYDSLGHDARSMGAPGHRRLIERLVGWLLERPG